MKQKRGVSEYHIYRNENSVIDTCQHETIEMWEYHINRNENPVMIDISPHCVTSSFPFWGAHHCLSPSFYLFLWVSYSQLQHRTLNMR
jgi:hypothetical protein